MTFQGNSCCRVELLIQDISASRAGIHAMIKSMPECAIVVIDDKSKTTYEFLFENGKCIKYPDLNHPAARTAYLHLQIPNFLSRVEYTIECEVKETAFNAQQQYDILNKRLHHEDLPALYATYGAPNANFKNPDQLTHIPIQEIDGEVEWVEMEGGKLIMTVMMNTRPDIRDVLVNSKVYACPLYMHTGGRIVNVIRVYLNIPAQMEG